MTVSYKAKLDSEVVNAAFISKIADDIKTGKFTLAKAAEGNTILSVQKSINEIFSNQGTTEGDVNAKNYANENFIANGDSQKTCVEKIDAQLDTTNTSIASHIISNAAHTSADITYDDTVSGNGAATVKAAIDDNESRVQAVEDAKGAANGYCPLDAGSKVPTGNLPDSVLGAMQYQSAWDADTNTPALVSSVGTDGHYYVVNVAGATNLDGVSDWENGDWAVYNGAIWEKIDNSDKVSSVNGQTGVVVLAKSDVGLSNVTNDAQLKRADGDINTFAEKLVPVEADVVIIEDSENAFAKKKVKLANMLGGGGGGGGSFAWEMNSVEASPYESIENGISLFDFDSASDAEMFALMSVPESYKDGDQIFLKDIKYYTGATVGNVFFRVETQLLKAAQVMSALPIAGHTSTNAEFVLVGAASILREIGDLDLTSAIGEINAVAVNAGDTLLVRFYRDNTSETAPANADCRLLKYSASVKFDG